MNKTYSVQIGDQEIVFEFGRLAKQANGSLLCKQGDTTVLTTACITDKPREGLDFFPLLVDFEERYYSAGKIPGGFIKREGRPSETAVLSARVIDRSIRSLFEDWMRNDVHVVTTVLSVDQKNSPSVLGINAASAALSVSDIPWNGPVGAVRIGRIEGQLIVNPAEDMIADSDLDLVVAGHAEGVTMVEAGASEVDEETMINALELAQGEIQKIVDIQIRIRDEIGLAKLELDRPLKFDEIDNWISAEYSKDIEEAVLTHDKKQRKAKIDQVTDAAVEHFAEDYPGSEKYIASCIEDNIKKTLRSVILEKSVRSDGRKMDEIRPISCEVGVLPRVHGSALFTRGETQSLATTTLGMSGEDDQILDGLKENEPAKSFLLHYNFPPYSVGEVKPMRGPGRREIGHGALAERALRPVIPSSDQFPYVIRVVSDILESNGSSSQASICGGSLSMMHAGVPVSSHVAGIAMGLIKEDDNVQVLTDIQGLEDHYGDMDFKVAGTVKGITALQMDNKAGGITREILIKALDQAREGRLYILQKMEDAISNPSNLSELAPKIMVMNINPEKIRDLIGPGGKVIRSIIQETGAKINVDDTGEVYISASCQEALDNAVSRVEALTKDVKPGEMYLGTVTRMMNFGAFVELLPGKEGLLHISEVSSYRIPKVDDIFSSGDEVLVVVKEIDDMKRINLSRRRLFKDEEQVIENGFESALESEKEREKKIESIAGSEKSEDSGHSSRNNDKNARNRGPRRRSSGNDRNSRN